MSFGIGKCSIFELKKATPLPHFYLGVEKKVFLLYTSENLFNEKVGATNE